MGVATGLPLGAGGRAGAEWRDLRTRTMGGRREKLEAQKLDCGKARYGYIYVDKYHPDPKRRQTYELDPVEALSGLSKQQVVRDIFAWFLEGTKSYSIAKRLNGMGILSAGSPSHPPDLWSRETVRQLLRSRTYTGEFVRGGFIVTCPQIIDPETWHRVQERLENNKQQHIGRLWFPRIPQRHLPATSAGLGIAVPGISYWDSICASGGAGCLAGPPLAYVMIVGARSPVDDTRPGKVQQPKPRIYAARRSYR